MRTPGASRLPHFLLLGVLACLGSCGDPKKQASRDLKQRGYELSSRDFLLAAGAGDLESLELFVLSGMEVDVTDEGGNTALIRAAAGGHLDTVERLLGMGADPRHLNRGGRDALISCSAKGFEEIARMLLSRGADFGVRDAEGWSALTIAAYNGHEDVVSLLSASVLSTALDEALLVASFNGDTRVIATLLSQGADINSRSPEGKTPLMIAAETGKLPAVRVLLQHQANPYSEVEEGVNAGVLAIRAGHDEIQQLIADPDSWGSTAATERIVSEKSQAQEALLASIAVEETIEAPDGPVPSSGGAAPAQAETPAPREAAAGGGLASGGASGAGGSAQGGSESVASTSPAAAQAAAGPGPGGGRGTAAGTVASIPPAPAGPRAVRSGGTIAAAPSGAAPSRQAGASTASAAPALSAQRRIQVREEAASKPVVAMNGSTIRSTSPAVAPVRSMVLASFHQEPVPIRVTHVESNRAEVRRLDQPDSPPVAAVPGQLIPGTSYEVLGVERRFVSSKEGHGRMVDVSRVKVHDRSTGNTHLLVKDASGQSSDTYAILTSPNSQYRYVVKAGDVFRSAQPGSPERDYQVLDIRSSGVVVKDLLTAEVLTIARDGVQ